MLCPDSQSHTDGIRGVPIEGSERGVGGYMNAFMRVKREIGDDGTSIRRANRVLIQTLVAVNRERERK